MAQTSQQQGRRNHEVNVWRLRYRRAGKLAALVVVLSFVYGVGTSPYFWVRQVQVIAPSPQLAEQALAQIHVPAEASALFFPAQRLARTVEKSPAIKRAQVERDLPAKLVVHVWPRVPIAAVKCGDQFSLVDEEGVCVRQAAQAPERLMRIYGLVKRQVTPGQRLKDADLDLLTQCMAALKDKQIGSGLVIDFSQRYVIEVCTATGVRGKMGTADNLQRKLMMFAAILEELRQKGHDPEYIDVRIMDRPVWKP